MANTMNISLSEEQKGWLQSRRAAGGFASTSDVVRDLIRPPRERTGGTVGAFPAIGWRWFE